MKTKGPPLNDGYELHLLTYIITKSSIILKQVNLINNNIILLSYL